MERYYKGGTIPWVKSGELRETIIKDTEEHVTEAALRETNVKLVPAGALLLAMYGATVGRLGILGVPATTNQAVCHIIPDPNAAEVRYLFHALRNQVSNLVARGVGGAQPNISQGIVKELALPLPPLTEQRRIAEVLDRAGLLLAKRRSALAQLDALARAIFLDIFGDPVANPKGWPMKQLGQLLGHAEVFVDGDWVESKDQDPNGEVRLVQLADVGDGTYIDKSARFLNKQTALRLKCTSLKVGDVLVARMPDPLGRACIFPGDSKESVTVVDVCIIRPASAGPSSSWLVHCINSAGFRASIARLATGTTRERISRGNLSKLTIIVPPLHVQQDFALRAAMVEKLKTAHRASLTELDALFATLQHRAFRGEL